MKLTEELLKLSKTMAEAQVEYQKSFDALKKFDDDIVRTGFINDIDRAIQDRMQLEEAERKAFDKRKEAEANYKGLLRQISKSSSK